VKKRYNFGKTKQTNCSNENGYALQFTLARATKTEVYSKPYPTYPYMIFASKAFNGNGLV
jgi:hypothetical protein